MSAPEAVRADIYRQTAILRKQAALMQAFADGKTISESPRTGGVPPYYYVAKEGILPNWNWDQYVYEIAQRRPVTAELHITRRADRYEVIVLEWTDGGQPLEIGETITVSLRQVSK